MLTYNIDLWKMTYTAVYSKWVKLIKEKTKYLTGPE